MTWKSLASATLVDSHATLMTGQTSQNSHWPSSKFEPAELRVDKSALRVDESWRSNESESCNSHPLSSSFDQALKTGFLNHLNKFKELQRKTKQLIAKKKKDHSQEMKESLHDNPKRFWSFVKSTTTQKRNLNLLREGQSFVTDSTSKANLLNTYFHSIFTCDEMDSPDISPTSILSTQLTNEPRLCTFLANNIDFLHLQNLDDLNFETQWFLLKLNRLPRGINSIIFTTVYHSPKNDDYLLRNHIFQYLDATLSIHIQIQESY